MGGATPRWKARGMSTDWSQSGQTQTPAPTPTPVQRFFAWTRRLGVVRPAGGRVLGGVAAALAQKVGIGAGWMRLILVGLVLFAGLSLWFYAIAWALLPDERTGTIPLERWIT